MTTSEDQTQTPLLRMTSICKSFPGVRALHEVDLDLYAGEVLALLGENGAGKSTLIKILGGAQLPNSGKVEIEGKQVRLDSPVAAQRAGVGVIYQEFNLVPTLTARENIFLGQEGGMLSRLRAGREHSRAVELFERIGVRVDPKAMCQSLTVAQQQAVEIAKALAVESRIIVMDEPSATLTPQEVDALFAVVAELKSQGIGIIYVSHRLSEIFKIADRVTVLRDGELVGTKHISELTRDSMIKMMVGRSLESEFPAKPAKSTKPELSASSEKSANSDKPGQPRLRVAGLKRGSVVKDISFEVYEGEILALTGLVGAGRTEVARLIFGADKREAGTIELDGKELNIKKPGDAIAAGICLLTEDRKGQGLVLSESVQKNFGLPNMSRFTKLGLIDGRAESKRFANYVEQMQIKIASHEQLAGTLSGGNQQKVVLAKWLERDAEVVIFDEPTRGIDVGAKYEIYVLMQELAAKGKAIIMISSELPEVLGMADRILVMHEGSVTGEITDVKNTTQEQVMRLAVK
jgi:ribose transport system ATP-binding protein